jgi:hypothetical protein
VQTLQLLAALAAQLPDVELLQRGNDGTVTLVSDSDITRKVDNLVGPAELETWVAKAKNHLASTRWLLVEHNSEFQRVLRAARAQDYRPSDVPAPNWDLEWLQRYYEQVWKANGQALVFAAEAVSALGKTVDELDAVVTEWQDSRPNATARQRLRFAVAIGGVIFGLGVGIPLAASGAPHWLTVEIPAIAFLCGAVLVTAAPWVSKLFRNL